MLEMKKLNVYLLMLLVSAMCFMLACNNSKQNSKNAKENALEAKLELQEKNDELLDDVKKTKIEAMELSEKNKQSLVDFKTRISNEQDGIKANYLIDIKRLNDRNNDLLKMMINYEGTRMDDWENFKLKYHYEMDSFQIDLDKLIKD